MKKLLFLLGFLGSVWSHAQDCNCAASATDLTIPTGQTSVVNAYFPGSSSVLKGGKQISLGTKRTVPGAFTDSGGTISAGDMVMIVQMQGVEIDPTIPDMETINVLFAADRFNSTDYGDGSGGLDHAGYLDNGGFAAGRYEYAIATNSVSAIGGTLTIENELSNSYYANSTPAGNFGLQTFQVIKVGNYNDLTIDSGGEVTTVPWNGATGGVIAIDVMGTLTVNGKIDADGAGFRGGLLDPTLDNNEMQPGWRGEGIAGRPTQVFHYQDDFSALTSTRGLSVGYPGGTATVNADIEYGGTLYSYDLTYNNERGPGAPANAGGGGLLNNGGGGGSNGGRGGAGATSGDGNSGDYLLAAAGGAQLSLAQGERLFLGGGGGSGGMATPNNSGFPIEVQSGHPGGGAIVLRADYLIGIGSISTNGDNGGSFSASNPQRPEKDGSGGGGGGAGTIIVVTSSEDISSLSISAAGGDGSSLTGTQMYISPDGGGGGGSGGNVTLVRRGGAFSVTPTTNVSGGAAGGTQGTPNAQSEGGAGAIELLTTPPTSNLDCSLISLPAPAPGGVTGAIVWFTAEEEVGYNGSNQVSSWGDYSPSGYIMTTTAVTGISGSNPDYIAGSFTDVVANSNPEFNFNPSLSFNEGISTDDYLSFSGFSNLNGSAVTVFAVPKIAAATPNDQTFFSYLPNDNVDDEFDFGISNDGGSDVPRLGVLDTRIDGVGDIRDNQIKLIALDFNNTNANFWVNNGTASTSAANPGTLDTGGILVVGQDIDGYTTPSFDNTRELQGQIGSVLIFDKILSAVERQKVFSYLGIKYGVTLDQTINQDYLNSIGDIIYPAASDAAYSPYDFDITGIGRDDGSRLNQLRSKSVNADAMITGSKTSGFSTDRQFVVWGNNDGGMVFNSIETSAGITDRIQREWKVALTNLPGSIDLSIDLSGTTGTPLSSEIVALVIDDDGDFSNGYLRKVAANTWDGTTATFEDVTLSDGEVFTVAEVSASPAGIANNTLWLRGGSGVTGTPIDTWSDQSGNGNNATSAGTERPTLVSDAINFNDAIDFDGVDDDLRGSAGLSTQDIFTIMVPDVTFNAGSTGKAILGFDTNATNGIFLGSCTGSFTNEVITYFINAAYGSAFTSATYALNASEPQLINVTNDVAVDSELIYLNHAFATSTETGTFTNFSTQYIIGDNPTEAYTFAGLIPEVISFSAKVTDLERQKLNSYLAIKYGITLFVDDDHYLASDGSIIYEKTILPAEYNRDIAGIVRDDISALSQTKSKSENNDAIVTMALTDNGGTFASPNTFTKNLSSLAWGNDNDDNGTIEDVTSEVPSNVVTRLDREWRVQENGSVGQVTLQMDISGVTPNVGIDFTGHTTDDFFLMIDEGGDFDNGISRSIAPSSYNSSTQVVTFEVDFTDGDIFTLATSKVAPAPGGVQNGLQVWLYSDAGTDVTTDGTEVNAWTDQSSNGYSFTDGVLLGVNGPTYRDGIEAFNNHAYLEFNQGGSTLENLSSALTTFPSTDYTTFNVFRSSSSADGHIMSYTAGASQEMNIHDPDAVKLENQGNDNNTSLNAGNGITHILATYLDNQVANDPMSVFLDGAAAAGNAYNSGATANFTANGTLSIGQELTNATLGTVNSGFQFEGDLGETILYSRQLSTTELAKVQSYLAVKYGITINSGDYDYQSSNGTTIFPGNSNANYGGYRTDIGILGRDDNSALNQLTSKSVNGTAVLSVTKNAPFTADDQFFAWGHNGLLNGSNGTDFPSGTEGRIARIWKVSSVNSPLGTMDMTFDLTGIGINSASDIRLIVDTDGDGDLNDATILVVIPTQNGNNFTFSGLDMTSFSNGAQFSIATISQAASPLPLDWLSFELKEEHGRVAVAWSTTNEVDVSHFEVERSADGKNFEVIALVNANNTSGIHQYGYLDMNPLPSVNYYRIKQLDFDGSEDFTKMRFVVIGGSDWHVTIYPNPTTEYVWVSSSLETTGRIRLLDLTGKTIKDFPYDKTNSRLDVSDLNRGVYILEMRSALGVMRQKISKK